MKKVGELNSEHGKIEYFKNDKGQISTQKPVSNVVMTKYLVTPNPSEYSSGTPFDDLNEAINHCAIMTDMMKNQHYVIELCYTDKEQPPQYIFAHDNGKRVRVL
jgi:hypothetical protein